MAIYISTEAALNLQDESTKLLSDAKAAGCRTISGLEMFLYQAAAQFEVWTGQSAPAQVMRAVLESHWK